MTQYWGEQKEPHPITLTFNQFFLDARTERTRGDTAAFSLLILEEKPIDGDLAASLNDVARKSSQGGKHTWLKLLFGERKNEPLSKDLIDCKGATCALGEKLVSASIECYLHYSESKVREAYKLSIDAPSMASSDCKAPIPTSALTLEKRQKLAERILGRVRITDLSVEVRKKGYGAWRKSSENGILPITSKDLLRFKVNCNLNAHIYAFWISSSHRNVTPLYPWLPDEWSDAGALSRDVHRRTLTLPDVYSTALGREKCFQSHGAPGAETIVAFASIRKLELSHFQSCLAAVPRYIKLPLLWRDEQDVEQLVLETWQPSHIGNFRRSVEPEDDSIAQVMDWIGRLQIHVDDAKALVVPSLGGE
jgi:hypothetical protein